MEMQRNAEKFSEIQRNADILMTFMAFMTFMTHWNVIFDILEPPAFRKYSTSWILQIFVEISKITRFFWENFPKPLNPLTNPRVFVRFGNTKGEIQVKKKVAIGGFGGVGNQPPHPPKIWESFPKKISFIFGPSLTKGKGWDGVTRYAPT